MFINDKRIRIIIGHYGSGKTEFSVNYAMKLKQATASKVAIADLDIVNVYFRSREKQVMLEEQGIKVIASSIAGNALDLPAVAADIITPLEDKSYEYVIDVGGDSVGARVLGRFKNYIEDADYDIEAMIVNDAAQDFAEGEAYGFLLGNGVLQPRGMMTVATAYTGDNSRAWGTVQKFKTGVNGSFAATPNGGKILIDAAMSLRGAYRAGAIWGMNRFTFAEAMKLQDSDGNFIWQPTWNLTDSPFGMILGIPVVPDFDHMADIANDSLSMFVGDLNQAYQIVDRRGVNVIRDNITNPDVVQWYFTKRTGGDLVNSEAVRFVEFKA